ncbi:MAG: thioesterase family protein [Pseudomonadota bacterium]
MNKIKAPAASDHPITIPPEWMQGETVYGGLSSSLCLQNAIKSSDDLPPLRSAHICFISASAGCINVTSEILRKGRSVCNINSDIHTEKGLVTRGLFCFGAKRDSVFDRTFIDQTELVLPDRCPEYETGANAFKPKFIEKFEMRVMEGCKQDHKGDCTSHKLWIRHRDRKEPDTLTSLIAVADIPAAVIAPMFPSPAGFVSMSWYFDIVSDDLETRDGWWLVEETAENASQGYTSQSMLVRNSDGNPVLIGRQNMVLFT